MELSTSIIDLHGTYYTKAKAANLNAWLQSSSKPAWAAEIRWSVLRDIGEADEDLVKRVGDDPNLKQWSGDSLLRVWRKVREMLDKERSINGVLGLPPLAASVSSPDARQVEALRLWRTLIGALRERRLQADEAATRAEGETLAAAISGNAIDLLASILSEDGAPMASGGGATTGGAQVGTHTATEPSPASRLICVPCVAGCSRPPHAGWLRDGQRQWRRRQRPRFGLGQLDRRRRSLALGCSG